MEKDFTFIKLYDEKCAKNLSKLTTISKNIYKTEYKNIKQNWANDFRHQTNMLNACMLNQDIKDNDYILCIFYCTSRYADFQFAMTETVSEGETYFQAFKRGLGEELGLRYLNTSEPEFSVKVKSHDRIFHMYSVNLNSEYISYVKKPNPMKKSRDIKNKKVAAVLYGSEDKILEYFSYEKLLKDINNDQIAGVFAVKFKNIKEYLKTRL